MATTVKGRLPCPNCKSEQDVKHDGRKYFINCTECRVMTSYQSKIAKASLEKILSPKEESKPEKQPPKETLKPEAFSVPTPARVSESPEKSKDSFFSYLDNMFNDDDERKRA